jgi:hypothetical protein
LLDELRGQAQRQLLWELHLRELEMLRGLLVWKRSGECREYVTLLGELLQQRRQRRLDLCKLRLLGGHVEAVGVTGGILIAQNSQSVGVDGDELAGRGDLRPQRSLLHRGEREVARESEVRCGKREARLLGMRCERFDRAPVQAEHVRYVRDAELRGVEGEIHSPRAGGWCELLGGLLSARRECRIDARQVRAPLRQNLLVGDTQGRLG